MLPSATMRRKETCPNHSFNSEDPSVVAAARAGDCEAFDVLASTYQKKILNIVQRITRNLDDAEDVTQQALMKAFLNVRGFRGTSSFSAWLTRIAINEAFMWIRRPLRRTEVNWLSSSATDELGIIPEIADARPNPEQRYEKQEGRQLLIAAIRTLKPASQLALEICDLNERPVRDLALVQGISLGAAKSRLSRSRHILRAKLTRLLRTRTTECVRSPGLLA